MDGRFIEWGKRVSAIKDSVEAAAKLVEGRIFWGRNCFLIVSKWERCRGTYSDPRLLRVDLHLWGVPLMSCNKGSASWLAPLEPLKMAVPSSGGHC